MLWIYLKKKNKLSLKCLQIIKEITSLKLNSDVSTIDNIIQYHENLKRLYSKNY